MNTKRVLDARYIEGMKASLLVMEREIKKGKSPEDVLGNLRADINELHDVYCSEIFEGIVRG